MDVHSCRWCGFPTNLQAIQPGRARQASNKGVWLCHWKAACQWQAHWSASGSVLFRKGIRRHQAHDSGHGKIPFQNNYISYMLFTTIVCQIKFLCFLCAVNWEKWRARHRLQGCGEVSNIPRSPTWVWICGWHDILPLPKSIPTGPPVILLKSAKMKAPLGLTF